MLVPMTERETLKLMCRQVELDLSLAHAEICKLQNIDATKFSWPDWSPQANTLRWIVAVRDKFNLES